MNLAGKQEGDSLAGKGISLAGTLTSSIPARLAVYLPGKGFLQSKVYLSGLHKPDR